MLVKKPDDYIVYAGITVFANAGSNILNFIHAKKYCLLKFDMGLALKRHLKPIMIIFASTVATTIYINSDTTMLGFMGTDFEVGIYSVSSKIYKDRKTDVGCYSDCYNSTIIIVNGTKKDRRI